MKMQGTSQTPSVANGVSSFLEEQNQRESIEHLVPAMMSQLNNNSFVRPPSSKITMYAMELMCSILFNDLKSLNKEPGYKHSDPIPTNKATEHEYSVNQESVEVENLDEERIEEDCKAIEKKISKPDPFDCRMEFSVEPTDEERQEIISPVIGSGLTVNPLGGCDAFEEFEMVNSKPVALFRGDSVSSDNDKTDSSPKSKPSVKVVANPDPTSLPSNSGTRQSVDDVFIAEEIAIESALPKKKQSKEKLLSTSEEEKLLPSYISLFSSQCGPPVSVTPDMPLAIIESDPAGAHIQSRAVYIKQPHPQHLDFPEGAFSCFLPFKMPSAEYWDRVVW